MADKDRKSTTATSPPAAQAGSSSPAVNSPPPAAQDTAILPAHHWTPLSPEDDAIESGNLSTSSITSSILNYRTLHGRRYHSDMGNASYWASNDEKQNESMDLTHYALTLGCDDKLYLAPLEKNKIRKVIDIGTGTGIWAIDFADDFPEAEVIGTDISPIQPTWIPPNLKFEIEDCTREWTFAPDSADYIHLRWLVGSVVHWDALFAEAYKTCRPGGWVESFEPGTTVKSDHTDIPTDSALSQWSKFFVEGGKKIGRPFTVVNDGLQRKALEAAGFVNIQEFTFKRPLGTWPKDPVKKEVGAVTEMAMLSDAEGYILFLADTLGWSKEEVQVYIAHYRQEVRSNKYTPYYEMKIIWGQKPGGAV